MAPLFGLNGYVALLLLLLPSLNLVSGGKLLVVPMDGSHWLSMKPVLMQLYQNGHEVVVVAPEVNVHVKRSEDVFAVKTYPVSFTQEQLDENIRAFGREIFEDLPFLNMFFRRIERLKNTSALFYSSCEELLYNQELMSYLRQSDFDALFTDPFWPCGQIVAEYLGTPSVLFLKELPCSLDSKAAQCPKPPSYVPKGFTGYSDHMTFAQRVKNMLFHLSESFLCNLVYSPYGTLASEFLQRDMTVVELLSNGALWLMKEDFLITYPKPLMPNIIHIGGINCAWKNPLSQVCESFHFFPKSHQDKILNLGQDICSGNRTVISEVSC